MIGFACYLMHTLITYHQLSCKFQLECNELIWMKCNAYEFNCSEAMNKFLSSPPRTFEYQAIVYLEEIIMKTKVKNLKRVNWWIKWIGGLSFNIWIFSTNDENFNFPKEFSNELSKFSDFNDDAILNC